MPTNIEKLWDEELVAAACEKILEWTHEEGMSCLWYRDQKGVLRGLDLDGNLMLCVVEAMEVRGLYIDYSHPSMSRPPESDILCWRANRVGGAIAMRSCADARSWPRDTLIVALLALEQANA